MKNWCTFKNKTRECLFPNHRDVHELNVQIHPFFSLFVHQRTKTFFTLFLSVIPFCRPFSVPKSTFQNINSVCCVPVLSFYKQIAKKEPTEIHASHLTLGTYSKHFYYSEAWLLWQHILKWFLIQIYLSTTHPGWENVEHIWIIIGNNPVWQPLTYKQLFPLACNSVGRCTRQINIVLKVGSVMYLSSTQTSCPFKCGFPLYCQSSAVRTDRFKSTFSMFSSKHTFTLHHGFSRHKAILHKQTDASAKELKI